jgi:hypothetical protein
MTAASAMDLETEMYAFKLIMSEYNIKISIHAKNNGISLGKTMQK